MADIIRNIVTRIDSTANWTTLNPIPANGEQCIEVLQKGLFKLKVGDGVTPWIALKYVSMGEGDSRIGSLSDLITRDKSTIVAAINSVQEEVNLTEDDILKIKKILENVIPQYSKLPTPTGENVGTVAQYIGQTSTDYLHNYFYEVVAQSDIDPESGEEVISYKWVQTNVQPAGGASDIVDIQINDTSIVDSETKIANIKVDSEVTEDSDNLITSGGVFAALAETQPVYTAEEPSTVEVGGFPINSKPENMTFAEFADKLLHKYVAPTNILIINPNASPRQLGTILDVVGTSTVTRKATSDYPLTKLVFYLNNVAKETITEGIDVKTKAFTYTFTNVGTTSNTKYFRQNFKTTLTDSYGSNINGTAAIDFVAPTFYGKVAIPSEYDDTPAHVKEYLQNNIETVLGTLTKKNTTSTTIDNACTLTKEHYIFVTPFVWSGTKKIYDTITNMDYTSSTSTFTHNHTENGVTTNYNVYYLTDYAGSGNSFTFRLTVDVREG
jgi:hypothetical protein